MNAQYYLCIDSEPVMSVYMPMQAICIVATFGSGEWIADKIGGPFDTRHKARIAAKKEATARNMPAYDTSTIRPTPIY